MEQASQFQFSLGLRIDIARDPGVQNQNMKWLSLSEAKSIEKNILPQSVDELSCLLCHRNYLFI